jgi:hypothetical protein
VQGSIGADKITGFRQLQTPQGVIAEITLGIEDLGSWVGYDFTGATEPVCAAQIRLYFEPLTGRWLCLEATWKPAEAPSESSAALGRLTRVVFDQNDSSLRTLADSLQAGRTLPTPITEKK